MIRLYFSGFSSSPGKIATPGMSNKAQHDPAYRHIPPMLRAMRERAGLTQRAIGQRLRKPQSWVYNCETANRRVDVMEYIAWCRACDVEPEEEFKILLRTVHIK